RDRRRGAHLRTQPWPSPRARAGPQAPRGGGKYRSGPILHAHHAALRDGRPALRLAEPPGLRGERRAPPCRRGGWKFRSPMTEQLIVGLVSVSDRASAGIYKDEGVPALKAWLASAIAAPAWHDETRLIADEQPLIEATLKELVDRAGCHLVL